MVRKFAAFSLCLLLGASASAQDSPEHTIRTFFDQMKKQNLPEMVDCFVTDSLVNNLNFRYRAKTDGIIPPFKKGLPLPNEYNIYRELNRMSIKASVYSQIHTLALMMVLPAKNIGTTTLINSEKDVDALIGDLNPGKLSSIEILDITSPFDDKSKAIIEKDQKEKVLPAISGLADRVVLVRLQQREFVVPLVLIKLDEKWGILSLGLSSYNLVGFSDISHQEYIDKFVTSKIDILAEKPLWKP